MRIILTCIYREECESFSLVFTGGVVRAAPVRNLGKCKISVVGRASGDPQVQKFSLARPGP